MGRELEDQAVMIDEVDSLADRVGGEIVEWHVADQTYCSQE